MRERESAAMFSDLLVLTPAALKPVANALRKLVVSLDKNHVEVVWLKQRIASFGVGPRKMSEHYAYIAIHAAHVNLGFYRGVSLTDASGMLAGTGKALRHVSLKGTTDVRNPAIATLLQEAIAERKRWLRCSPSTCT